MGAGAGARSADIPGTPTYKSVVSTDSIIKEILK